MSEKEKLLKSLATIESLDKQKSHETAQAIMDMQDTLCKIYASPILKPSINGFETLEAFQKEYRALKNNLRLLGSCVARAL